MTGIDSTKERIMNVALQLIEQEGVQSITVRKIASMAEVNVAAVNYHFGSKDTLINETLKYMGEKFDRVFSYLMEKEFSPEVRLRSFLTSYFEIAINYPDIAKNFITKNINSSPTRKQYAEFVKNEGLQELVKTVCEIRTSDDHESLLLRTFQMMSSLALPIVLNEAVKEILGIDFGQEEVRMQYIDILVQNIAK